MGEKASNVEIDGGAEQAPGPAVTGNEHSEADEFAAEKARVAKAFVKSLPEPVQECVKALSELDTKVSALEADFKKEMRELERKYDRLGAPMFEKRAAIVNGAEKADGEGVPGFWLGVMQNCHAIAESITDKDEVILKSLTDITAKTLPEETGIGFQLAFHFKENDFFANKVLTKTYFEADDGDSDDAERTEGTEIEWKPGKNVTVKTIKKHQRNKKGKGTRTVTKTEPCPSFFNFFSPPKIPGPGEEPLEEEEEEQREMELQADYDMGLAFHERLVPHAIKWFTGEADDEDDEDDEEDDMDESDDEEEDEEEDAGSDPPFPKQVEQAFRRMKEEGKGSAKFESVYSFSENRTEELQDKLALGGDPTLDVAVLARTHTDPVEALGFARVVDADDDMYGAGQVDKEWRKLHSAPSDASWAKFRAAMGYFADCSDLSAEMKKPQAYASEIGVKEAPEAVYVRTGWGNGCCFTCFLCTAHHVYKISYSNG